MEERLQKFLARAGVASRRKAEELIKEGRVSVNGRVIRRMGEKVDGERDQVRVDTVLVKARHAAPPEISGTVRRRGEPRPEAGAQGAPLPPGAGPRPDGVYMLLNKPLGFLTTTSDDRGRPTVMALLPRLRGRAWPVGRLDEDSEGLLLVTDDGALTNLLTHPRYEVSKVYDLRVRGEVTPEDVQKVERGVWLSEGKTGPARMFVRRRGREISHVELTLREGRNREIRRIFARLRHPVLSLRRVAVGPLALEGMKPGQFRRLTPAEVRSLYAAALRGGGEAPKRKVKPGRRGVRPGRRHGAGAPGGGFGSGRPSGKPRRFPGSRPSKGGRPRRPQSGRPR